MTDAYDYAQDRINELLKKAKPISEVGYESQKELIEDIGRQLEVMSALANHDPIRYTISAGKHSKAGEVSQKDAGIDSTNIMVEAMYVLMDWNEEDPSVTEAEVTTFTNFRDRGNHVRTEVDKIRVGLDGDCYYTKWNDPEVEGQHWYFEE